MSQDPMIEAVAHPMVLAAMGRLATLGGWQRILDGKPLEETADLNDAELLIAAGVLRRTADERLEPVHLHPWYFDPSALAGGVIATLRGALRHAEGADLGWEADDQLVRAQGLSSASAAVAVVEGILPLLRSSHAAFVHGAGCFLDVGVGVGTVLRHVCDHFPRATAVGIDVLRPVLDAARRNIAASDLGDRIELRHQSVDELPDRDRFDLAWVPQAFIPRADLYDGLRAVLAALRPDRWVVLPITASPRDSTEVDRAIRRHGAHLTGGGPLSVRTATDLLSDAGFVDVRPMDLGAHVVMTARKPGAA